jgi:hypothetical protein
MLANHGLRCYHVEQLTVHELTSHVLVHELTSGVPVLLQGRLVQLKKLENVYNAFR